MTDYEKGYLDGYRTYLYNCIPKFGCNFDNVEEYEKGLIQGKEDFINGVEY